jgi:pimeloyl-ACP methyl ester carboxylesterase
LTDFIRLDWSELANGPVAIAYRSYGAGPAIVFLHGGWGYEVYPLDAQIDGLAERFRIVIPDRCGYGHSSPVSCLGPGFHRLAVLETIAMLDQLQIAEAVWWGHSDGAIIAALAGIQHPERCRAVILEALHLFSAKPLSRKFFEQMAWDPDSFGPRVAARLSADHGEERWRRVLELDGAAWLEIAARAVEHPDLFDGRLSQLRPPALLIHGGKDPRTEPAEWQAIRTALPRATIAFSPAAGHSPHSETGSSRHVTAAVEGFLSGLT